MEGYVFEDILKPGGNGLKSSTWPFETPELSGAFQGGFFWNTFSGYARDQLILEPAFNSC